MNLFGFWKKQSLQPPIEVLNAACNFYGIAPEHVPAMQAEQLNALADNLWVVRLNDRASALVAYVPEDNEQTVAAPWFTE
ncbi:hypothetical protein [Tengunoibacter tsumagoiensis]|uniref:Uncharacterized protein n=1 Tax=Tengunoibacter tsumagoiensis TaxID=2014871 RepID=A0A402AA85_9CHLR|nr:hypothetical protein [Tengunoibacter tsumagoiensis]GCE16008.1 hypothetical protein KTT_58670 [Tengunoibacter tsumagoiensis]